MLGWILWLAALGAVLGAWRAWRHIFRIWPWVIGAVILAIGGGILRILPSTSMARVGAFSGLPLKDNPRLMPVYSPSGREILLDAAVFPVAVVSAQQPKILHQIAQAYTRLPANKRPLWIVVTGFSSDDPQIALKQARALMTHQHVALPWAAQIGPPTLYSPSTPAVLSADVKSVHRIMGLTTILHALPDLVGQPKASAIQPAPRSHRP